MPESFLWTQAGRLLAATVSRNDCLCWTLACVGYWCLLSHDVRAGT